MYEYIRGKIEQKYPTYVVIDINGLAYKINISLNTYENIQGLTECKLLLFQSIKEDSHTLYGFFSMEERDLFKNLISVSGIGTNTAILILSSFKTNEIIHAIIRADVPLLKSIKGVGPKTAQRMIVELQDGMKKFGEQIIPASSMSNPSVEEAVAALTMLGFKKNEAEKAVVKVVQSNPEAVSVEQMIKLALKGL